MGENGLQSVIPTRELFFESLLSNTFHLNKTVAPEKPQLVKICACAGARSPGNTSGSCERQCGETSSMSRCLLGGICLGKKPQLGHRARKRRRGYQP